jgi:catechol 2,3-dioxygenase-like lactoylglutathione lyase family enzyme
VTQSLAAISYLVRDYDDAITWFSRCLSFVLVEDTPLGGGKRWVVMAPPGGAGARLVLAKVAEVPLAAGGRVAFFLHTDDFARDHAAMLAAGVHFREFPRHEAYGTVAVFEDLYGNGWDLIEPVNSRA